MRVTQILEREKPLTLDEIFYLLIQLNPNPLDGRPSPLYQEHMKKLLRLPQVNDAFLVFLCTLKPDDHISFWVSDEARHILQEERVHRWERSRVNSACSLTALPYQKHEQWRHIIDKKILYGIIKRQWESSSH